ncbi:hypothetical protein [Sodalis sp. (in: enterobacteria)]|uniref:hypothetical protein n=1 Tax=Sodalis sp. (in: enterobacteria) TaxID=1898979 RepID=UPI003F683F75
MRWPMMALLMPVWGCSATEPPSAIPPADDNTALSAPAGQPAGGCPPSRPPAPRKGAWPGGVALHHASDYGAWCLTLRAQLQAINAFYSAQERARDEP